MAGFARRRGDDAGLCPGPWWCGFVSAIIAAPDDRAGVIDWRSGGFAHLRPTRDDPFPARTVIDHPGASWSPEHPMIVVRTVEWAEQALGAGEIGCPHLGCGGTLTRWGYGRRRRIRRLGAQILDVRPRRARCTRSPAPRFCCRPSVQPRLADTTEVIGTGQSTLPMFPIRFRQAVSFANVPKSVPIAHETAPGAISGGRFALVAGTGFEPATSGL